MKDPDRIDCQYLSCQSPQSQPVGGKQNLFLPFVMQLRPCAALADRQGAAMLKVIRSSKGGNRHRGING